MNRHEPFEELISASLHGDLTEDERRRLDAHLDGCDQCRQTLAAFSDQRRIVAGLRHVAPPRDLGARVRAGVESAEHSVVAQADNDLHGRRRHSGSRSWRAPRPRRAQRLPAESGRRGLADAKVRAAADRLRSHLAPAVHDAGPVCGPVPERSHAIASRGNSLSGSAGRCARARHDHRLHPATPASDEQSLTVVDGSTGDVVVEPSPPGDTTAAVGEPVAAELSSDVLPREVSRQASPAWTGPGHPCP